MNIDLLFRNIILDSMISLCIFEKLKKRKSLSLIELLFYYSVAVNRMYPDRSIDKTYSKFQENIREIILLLSNKNYISIVEKNEYQLLNNSFKITDLGIQNVEKLKNDYYINIKEIIKLTVKEYPKVSQRTLKKVVYNEDK